jgi:hypothetical protein
MIDHIVGNNPLPANIRQDIIERTDGIPLFVEEMTKAVLAAESEGEARRAAAFVPSPALAVPATLHASLMARLDRLGPAKELAPTLVAAVGCSAWSPHQRNVTAASLAEAHALGLKVITWTVNEAPDMERLIQMGIDGIITDYPNRLRAVMAEKEIPLPPAVPAR